MEPVGTNTFEFKSPEPKKLKREADLGWVSEQPLKRKRADNLLKSSDETHVEPKNCLFLERFYALDQSFRHLHKRWILACDLVSTVNKSVLEWNEISIAEISAIFEEKLIPQKMQTSCEILSTVAALLQNAMLALTFRLNATAVPRTSQERKFIDQITDTAMKIFKDQEVYPIESEPDFYDVHLPLPSYQSSYFDVAPWENRFLEQSYELSSQLQPRIAAISHSLEVAEAIAHIAKVPVINLESISLALNDFLPFLLSQTNSLDTNQVLLVALQALYARLEREMMKENKVGFQLAETIARFRLAQSFFLPPPPRTGADC